ncbi:hypothetical protein Syun_001527 [Stephania yunnanensis]|uniref:Uncharacterized protein n=1 Tax=Stephania yunnanensis TaxID=152371 RepID=A0AAP0Q6D1_9MAGN
MAKIKFGKAFTEYLHGDNKKFLGKLSHVEYKKMKRVLNGLRRRRWREESLLRRCRIADPTSVVADEHGGDEVSQDGSNSEYNFILAVPI